MIHVTGRESAKHSTQFSAFQEAITFMIFSIEEGMIYQRVWFSVAQGYADCNLPVKWKRSVASTLYHLS